jgi:hypothetical protein
MIAAEKGALPERGKLECDLTSRSWPRRVRFRRLRSKSSPLRSRRCRGWPGLTEVRGRACA